MTTSDKFANFPEIDCNSEEANLRAQVSYPKILMGYLISRKLISTSSHLCMSL